MSALNMSAADAKLLYLFFVDVDEDGSGEVSVGVEHGRHRGGGTHCAHTRGPGRHGHGSLAPTPVRRCLSRSSSSTLTSRCPCSPSGCSPCSTQTGQVRGAWALHTRIGEGCYCCASGVSSRGTLLTRQPCVGRRRDRLPRVHRQSRVVLHRRQGRAHRVCLPVVRHVRGRVCPLSRVA